MKVDKKKLVQEVLNLVHLLNEKYPSQKLGTIGQAWNKEFKEKIEAL